MGIADDAVEVRAQGWRTLASLHAAIDTELERALQGAVELSVVEYTVLDALGRQHGWHMRMQQLAGATALSSSATTRLVNRLEERILTRYDLQHRSRRRDRRLSRSERLGTSHYAALKRALASARLAPELAGLVKAIAA